MSGLRFNKGKNKMGLLPSRALFDVAKVLTFGAEKYGPHNWEKGLSWTEVIDSLLRHLNALQQGEDYDLESGFLHISHVACNALMLNELYHTYPQGDDRNLNYLRDIKIGLDIDDVLADFMGAWAERFGNNEPEFWNFDPDFYDKYKTLDEEFWLNLKPLVNPRDLTFEPTAYITSRDIDPRITREWLTRNGFPGCPIETVGHNGSKIEACKKHGIEIFVDDRYENFRLLNSNGICTYLLTKPHNLRFKVGHKRLNKLTDL